MRFAGVLLQMSDRTFRRVERSAPNCHPLDGILTTRRSSKMYPRHGYLGRKGSNIELSLGGDRDLAAEFAARRRELEKRLRK